MTDKRAPTITPPGAPAAPSSDREVADFLSENDTTTVAPASDCVG